VLHSKGGARAKAPLEADVTTSTDISILYREFTDSLTEVLAETAGTPVRRGRLARSLAAMKRHPNNNEHEYFLAVENAFSNGKLCKMSATKTVTASTLLEPEAVQVPITSCCGPVGITKLVGCRAR
jgi:hypothetical protein